MEYQELILEEEGEITTITFSSPDNKVSLSLLEELEAALQEVDTKGLILEANENFSLGYDLEELLEGDKNHFHDLAEKGQEVSSTLENSSKATVSALTGYVLGPGLELALATDFRLGSDTAIFGFPEVRLGLIPAFGTLNRLPSIVGRNRSVRLLMTGGKMHAEEAQWMGLVDEISDGPAEKAREVTRTFISSPSVLEAKSLLEKSSLAEERRVFSNCCTESTKERIKEFLESGSSRR